MSLVIPRFIILIIPVSIRPGLLWEFWSMLWFFRKMPASCSSWQPAQHWAGCTYDKWWMGRMTYNDTLRWKHVTLQFSPIMNNCLESHTFQIKNFINVVLLVMLEIDWHTDQFFPLFIQTCQQAPPIYWIWGILREIKHFPLTSRSWESCGQYRQV